MHVCRTLASRSLSVDAGCETACIAHNSAHTSIATGSVRMPVRRWISGWVSGMTAHVSARLLHPIHRHVFQTEQAHEHMHRKEGGKRNGSIDLIGG